MIYIVIGTRAQLVKMAPIILELESKNLKYELIHTGQHKESFDELCRDFNIEKKWHYLYPDRNEVNTVSSAMTWLISIILKIILSPYSLLPNYITNKKNIVLIHGDTFSTLLGCLLGKRLNICIGHVESGLRSFNLINPFPEEINRLITFRLSDIAFCPGQWACNNLSKYKNLRVINTYENTLLASLQKVIEKKCFYKIPDHAYVVVSIHRFENIFFKKRFSKIIDQIYNLANFYSIVFVLHPTTTKRLKKTGLINKIKHPNINLIERTSYSNFLFLLKNSEFVITDGGSNQEELSYLGVPTFLMRNFTERQEGLGKNIVIGNLSKIKLDEFIQKLSQIKSQKVSLTKKNRAIDIITSELSEFGEN